MSMKGKGSIRKQRSTWGTRLNKETRFSQGQDSKLSKGTRFSKGTRLNKQTRLKKCITHKPLIRNIS